MGVFESLLNHEYTISRRDRSHDGRGGWAIAWVDLGTVRGRLRPASSQERETADQEGRQITHVLYVVAGTDVGRGDQVEGAGIIVDVLGVREPSRAGHHLEVDCRERQGETPAAEGT